MYWNIGGRGRGESCSFPHTFTLGHRPSGFEKIAESRNGENPDGTTGL